MLARSLTLRYSQAILFSGLVTLSLFFLMQVLIAYNPAMPQPQPPKRDVVIGEVKPPPPEDLPTTTERPVTVDSPVGPVFTPSNPPVDRPGVIYVPPGPGGIGNSPVEVGPPDTDFPVALVQVTPLYPVRALRDGVEGFALLQFTVNERGLVEDIVVIDESPKGYGFSRAAITAAEKFRYTPRSVNGQAVATPGIFEKFEFVLDDG